MRKAEYDLDTKEWLPNKLKLNLKGSFWDVIESAGKPYHEVEVAKEYLKRVAKDYDSLTPTQKIDGARAARYLACLHRDSMSPAMNEIINEIEGHFDQTGTISGKDLGIVRRCYWQGNSWKSDWKFPEEPYLAKDERPGRPFYGLNEQGLMTNHATERTQNNLNNMRRTALNADVRAIVQDIEDQFLRDGFITKNQVDVLNGCCLYSNGRGSLRDLTAYKANFQAVRG